MSIPIHCKYDELVDPKTLIEHPKNRNQHPQDQIERLSELFKYHGMRHPIIVDADDRKTIIVGRGRQLTALRVGMEKVPVVYQKFDSEEQRYAFIQSDNAISEWSKLDLAAINLDLADLGPDFNLDMLGIRNFTLDFGDKLDPNSEWTGMPEFEQDDKTSFRHVIVHFDNNEQVAEFFELIGQDHTDKTKSIWFPEKENMDSESKRYE